MPVVGGVQVRYKDAVSGMRSVLPHDRPSGRLARTASAGSATSTCARRATKSVARATRRALCCPRPLIAVGEGSRVGGGARDPARSARSLGAAEAAARNSEGRSVLGSAGGGGGRSAPGAPLDVYRRIARERRGAGSGGRPTSRSDTSVRGSDLRTRHGIVRALYLYCIGVGDTLTA